MFLEVVSDSKWQNIREAYSFVATNYEPGDEIILLGFSRGAFTARSVAVSPSDDSSKKCRAMAHDQSRDLLLKSVCSPPGEWSISILSSRIQKTSETPTTRTNSLRYHFLTSPLINESTSYAWKMFVTRHPSVAFSSLME